jgi:hypothetical protein
MPISSAPVCEKLEHIPAIYTRIIAQCERRRMDLGWSCERLDRAAGLAAGHYAKIKHADSRSGRVARWEILDLIISALWPDQDFELLVLGNFAITTASPARIFMVPAI